MERIAKSRPNLSSPPSQDPGPMPAGRRTLSLRAVVTTLALALGLLCIALVQYSRCSYQPTASPPWSIDSALIASRIGVVPSESV